MLVKVLVYCTMGILSVLSFVAPGIKCKRKLFYFNNLVLKSIIIPVIPLLEESKRHTK